MKTKITAIAFSTVANNYFSDLQPAVSLQAMMYKKDVLLYSALKINNKSFHIAAQRKEGINIRGSALSLCFTFSNLCVAIYWHVTCYNWWKM